jgi:hypothetical protein
MLRSMAFEFSVNSISSFKREIVKDFCFDENLKGYSWGKNISL